jgi:hypothetical protein
LKYVISLSQKNFFILIPATLVEIIKCRRNYSVGSTVVTI